MQGCASASVSSVKAQGPCRAERRLKKVESSELCSEGLGQVIQANGARFCKANRDRTDFRNDTFSLPGAGSYAPTGSVTSEAALEVELNRYTCQQAVLLTEPWRSSAGIRGKNLSTFATRPHETSKRMFSARRSRICRTSQRTCVRHVTDL